MLYEGPQLPNELCLNLLISELPTFPDFSRNYYSPPCSRVPESPNNVPTFCGPRLKVHYCTRVYYVVDELWLQSIQSWIRIIFFEILTQFVQVLLVLLHSNLDPEHFLITILDDVKAKSATMESGKHVLIIGFVVHAWGCPEKCPEKIEGWKVCLLEFHGCSHSRLPPPVGLGK